MELGESFAGAAGEPDDPLSLVQLRVLLGGGDGFGAASCGGKHFCKVVAGAGRAGGGGNQSLGVGESLAGEPLCSVVVAVVCDTSAAPAPHA